MHQGIFFDSTKKRHTIVKRSMFFVVLCVCLICIGFVLDIFVIFNMPDIALEQHKDNVVYSPLLTS